MSVAAADSVNKPNLSTATTNGAISKTEGNQVFIQTLNPMTGKTTWKMQPEDYDYQQEVARAAFADMLHDSERNHLYYEGLKSAIALMKAKGKPVHVLDIGTGTGLLSMMAAKIGGVASITAVEEFSPMANCAQRVIRDNGFGEVIKLVRKRSSYVQVGPGLDMEQRANVLVTEVFDTELIGEGAIGTFNHAHEHLLTEDCLVVPTFGTMYAQVVTSNLCSRWNEIHPISLDPNPSESEPSGDKEPQSESRRLVPPSEDVNCVSLALHDLQLSQMKPEWFTPVTEPLPVFDFDFSGRPGPIPIDAQSCKTAKALTTGSCDAIFIWWELKMDPEKKITLSCAPNWAHPTPQELAWRDHWMQAIYYPLSKVEVNQGDDLTVVSNHDEYSLLFDVSKEDEKQIPTLQMPHPTGGIHLAMSRTRLGQINDVARNNVLVKALKAGLKTVQKENPVCLFLSELSLMPILAAKLGAGQVFVAEGNRQMRSVLEKYVGKEAEQLKERMVISEKSVVELTREDLPDNIDFVFAEPNFSVALLPWHNLLYWFTLQHLLGDRMESNPGSITCTPMRADLYAVPVEYEDLWKIRSPLHNVEGFEMKHFDEIILSACSVSDANVEPQPLWEYPCVARGRPRRLMSFDLRKKIPEGDLSVTEVIDIEDCPESGKVNGMALWMDWHFDESNNISSGPRSEVKVNSAIDWNLHCQQGVHFFTEVSQNDLQKVKRVQCETTFRPKEGDFEFQFRVL